MNQHVSVTISNPGPLQYAGAEYDKNDGAGQFRDWETSAVLFMTPERAAQWAAELALFAKSHAAVSQ